MRDAVTSPAPAPDSAHAAAPPPSAPDVGASSTDGAPAQARITLAPRSDGNGPAVALFAPPGVPLVAWQAAVAATGAAARMAIPEPLALRAVERVEAALEPLALPELRASAGVNAWQQLMHDGELARKFDAVQRQLALQTEQHHAIVATGVGLTGGLSIGYVIWLIRGGVLVSSMLSALPAWQMIDPLPVLAARRRDRVCATPEDAPVEELFDDAAEPPPAPPKDKPARPEDDAQ